jgi:hypothetical protein
MNQWDGNYQMILISHNQNVINYGAKPTKNPGVMKHFDPDLKPGYISIQRECIHLTQS